MLFSHSVMSDSLRPHGLQHAGFPVLHHLLELAQTHVHWVSDAIQPFSFSVALFSCLQSFQASGSFLISELFASDGQSFRASVSASVLLMSIQDWFPLGLTGFLCMMMQEKHVLSISEDTLCCCRGRLVIFSVNTDWWCRCNDDEDGNVILLAHQQMYYNYLQWAEQYDKHERNMKKYNEHHLPPSSS